MNWEYLLQLVGEPLNRLWTSAKGVRVRPWIQRHPRAVIATTGVSLVIMLVVLGAEALSGPAAISAGKVWYFDLNTGELFAARDGQTPPIAAPSGPQPDGAAAGVRAYVFACGDCGNKSERFVGYLQVYSLESKQPYLRRVEDGQDKWVLAGDAEAIKIAKEAQDRCGEGKRPRRCEP